MLLLLSLCVATVPAIPLINNDPIRKREPAMTGEDEVAKTFVAADAVAAAVFAVLMLLILLLFIRVIFFSAILCVKCSER